MKKLCWHVWIFCTDKTDRQWRECVKCGMTQ